MAFTQNHLALNNLILAAAHAAQGETAQSMACLAAAATDPDLEEALAELDAELEDAGCGENMEEELEEAGAALAKVMAATGKDPARSARQKAIQNADIVALHRMGGGAHNAPSTLKDKMADAAKRHAEARKARKLKAIKAPKHQTKAGEEEENMGAETASAGDELQRIIAATHNRANLL